VQQVVALLLLLAPVALALGVAVAVAVAVAVQQHVAAQEVVLCWMLIAVTTSCR
jgi:hypothetical protein